LKGLRKNRFKNKAKRAVLAEHWFSRFLVKIIIFNKLYNAHVRYACYYTYCIDSYAVTYLHIERVSRRAFFY
jgi:hypothetical protein